MPIKSFKELIVWQKSMLLCKEIYKLSKNFPKEETWGITSQIRRSAVSLPSNIAEGRGRGSRKEFSQFLKVAYGSGAELETQLEIARDLDLLNKEDFEKADRLSGEVMRMLNVMIKKLTAKT